MDSINKLYNDEEALNKFISDRVEGLTPQQEREVRRLFRDTVLMSIDETRSIAQRSVNEISELTKK